MTRDYLLLTQRTQNPGNYHVDYIYHVEEARPALLFPHAALPEEKLLGVAGHLRRGSRCDVAPGDASPVTLAQLLQAHQELPVLLLAPWNSCRASCSYRCYSQQLFRESAVANFSFTVPGCSRI